MKEAAGLREQGVTTRGTVVNSPRKATSVLAGRRAGWPEARGADSAAAATGDAQGCSQSRRGGRKQTLGAGARQGRRRRPPTDGQGRLLVLTHSGTVASHAGSQRTPPRGRGMGTATHDARAQQNRRKDHDDSRDRTGIKLPSCTNETGDLPTRERTRAVTSAIQGPTTTAAVRHRGRLTETRLAPSPPDPPHPQLHTCTIPTARRWWRRSQASRRAPQTVVSDAAAAATPAGRRGPYPLRRSADMLIGQGSPGNVPSWNRMGGEREQRWVAHYGSRRSPTARGPSPLSAAADGHSHSRRVAIARVGGSSKARQG